MEAGFVYILFFILFLLYACELPLHFIAKVKVKKVKEEVCRKSFHILLFCY